MIKDATQYALSVIFNIDDKVQYRVPKYQREYTWDREKWENLYNDLQENDFGYFLGSILCVDETKDALAIRPLMIIDGQQRLTAISLLYAAIYTKLVDIENPTIESPDDFIAEKSNLRYRLIQKQKNSELKVVPSTQHNNLDDYKSIMSDIGVCSSSQVAKRYKIRKIFKTYKYFLDRIKDLSYQELLNILKKINSAMLVKIEVVTNADAYILFESLNNRGEPLSAIDLIKTYILAEVEKKDVMSIDEAFDYWQGLITNLQDYKIQERFLRQFYNAFKYKEIVKIDGYSKATRSNIIKIYEKLIKKDVKRTYTELIEKSRIYKIFVSPQEIEASEIEAFQQGLIDLQHLGAAPSYTYLLYLLSEHKTKINLIKEVVDFFIKYFIRRNLTNFPGTSDLDLIFMSLIKLSEENKNSLSSNLVISFLTDSDRYASDEYFKEKLSGNVYDTNVDATRFLLCKIEEEHQTKENSQDLWAKTKSIYDWTIEHIFPKGSNIPSYWVNAIADGDVDKAKELQDEYVHHLGNLTLTCFNPKLSNLSFIDKRDKKDKKGNHIGYKNGLYLNKQLAQMDNWTIQDIKNRTNKMVDEIMSLYQFKS